MPERSRLSAASARWLSLVAILTAGLLVTFFRIGDPSLWLDEAYTWWFSRMGFTEMLYAARVDGVNPPLYYILSWMVAGMFGTGEAALRGLSGIAQLAAIVGLFLLGRQIAGAAAGVAAATLWALHPMALSYARDARPYALAGALGAFLVWLFLRLREHLRQSELIAAAGLMAAGLLTHYFFFVLVAALLLLSTFELRQRPRLFRYWSLATLGALVPLGLWLLWFFALPEPSLGIGWIDSPTLADLPATAWNLLGGYGGVNAPGTTALGLGAAAALVALLRLGPRRDETASVLAAGVLVPLLAVWTLSQRRPVYVDRYFLVLLPVAIALVGAGVAQAGQWLSHRHRLGSWGSNLPLLILLACALPAALRVHRDQAFAKEDWRQLTGVIAPGGAIASPIWRSEPEILLPLAYYLGPDVPVLESPTAADCREGCWYVTRKPYTATHAFGQSVQEPDRPWEAVAPEGCQELDAWRSETGVAALWIVCGLTGG